MKHQVIILFLAFIISCADGKEPKSPIIPLTYQSNAIGEVNTDPIPPEFRKNYSEGMGDHEYVKLPRDTVTAPETLISLKTLDEQKNIPQNISIALQNATIDEVVLAIKEVSHHNFLVHPDARNAIVADVTLEDVAWLKALMIITEASGLVATINGDIALIPGEENRPVSRGDMIMISTFASFIAGHKDRIIAAKLSKEIAEKRRSAAEERNITASIRDRSQRTTRSYRLKYADPVEAQKYLESLFASAGSRTFADEQSQSRRAGGGELPGKRPDANRLHSGRADNGISFSVFKPENMITVTAPRRSLDEIGERIEEIDVAPRQVYIVARIVEIQRNHIKELGVQWGGHHTRVTGNAFPQSVGVFGGGLGADGQDSAVSLPPVSAIDPVTGETLANPAGAVFGVSLGSVSGTTLLHAKLFALEQAGLSRTLSNPKVTAINGSKAVIKSGREIPYQSTSGNFGTTVRFKEAVISLSVTPLIIEGGRIRMTIEAKKDEVDTALSIQGAPAIKKKELTTSVIVENGGSAALGGIFVGEEGDFEERVPWFHKIPLLGSLFKNNRKINNELELLIFITPTIIEEQ